LKAAISYLALILSSNPHPVKVEEFGLLVMSLIKRVGHIGLVAGETVGVTVDVAVGAPASLDWG